jgi:soluble lytic murein transglycosylase-like protein
VREESGRDKKGEAAVRWFLIAAMALLAGSARAELWGYIDDQGVSHFAPQKLDDRYQLFFRGGTSLDPVPVDPALRAAQEALLRTPLYRRVVDHPNVRRYAALIERQAKASALEPALVKAVIAVESGFEPAAVSPKGALGLMQVLPDTGARYGLIDDRRSTVVQKLLDPATNVRIGARYLHDLLELFDHDLSLALAAYNAGEEAVRQAGNRVPPFAETRDYVALVRQFQALYQPQQVAPAPLPRPRLDLPGRKGAIQPSP